MVMSEEKLEDKRTSTAARMVWKNIRNNYNVNDWFNSNEIGERFKYDFKLKQIYNALRQIEKRNLIREEQKGVRRINESYLIQLIKQIPQKNYVRLANVIENFFIERSSSEDKISNELATAFLMKEQCLNLPPEEFFRQQMILILDNYRMETLEEK